MARIAVHRPCRGPDDPTRTRPAAVRTLCAELQRLYRAAGEPSTRSIAQRLGKGVLSHTSVHGVLRHPHERWGSLELVVECLGGDRDRFHELWVAARDAMDAE